METIKNYIENIFSGIPMDGKTLRAKEELLSNMEDKYNELKNSGKSENEAIGIVISEFGNIDELKKELGIENEVVNPNLRLVTKEEAYKFIEAKKEAGKAVGVVLCILGVALLILLGGMLESRMDIGGIFGVIALMVFVAGAVALFIPAGMKLSKYEYLKKDITMSEVLKKEIEELRESNLTKMITSIVIGVVLCILSVTPVVVFAVLGKFAFVGVVFMFLIVAIAVFLFVSAGNMYSAYDILLQRGDYKPKNKKSEKIISAVASVVWPLTVIAFLIWGFAYGGWGIAWILFPIVGITFGAFSALITAVMDEV